MTGKVILDNFVAEALVQNRLDDLIENLRSQQYKSGYLISKFGKLKL